MSIDLLGVGVRGQGQGVEGVVDVGGVEGWCGFSRQGGLVELGEVEATGLLDGGFGVFGSGTGVLFFFCEEGVFFGFFTGGFFAFRGGFFSVGE